jgi:hypothetical protein
LPDTATSPLRIAHFVTALNSGGAERQACYAAIEQRQQGHEVRLLTRLAIVGEDACYLPLLETHGVPARFMGSLWHSGFLDAWRQGGRYRAALRRLPAELAAMVLDLLGELLVQPVDVLHCYVDDCNIVGVIAGCLAGVPAVILSFRNGNPTHFPGLLRPWMHAWYQALRNRPGVRMCANAERGARHYEKWLGLPPDSVPIIRNAFVPPDVPGREEAQAWRQRMGIPAGAPLVAGVFRLQPEKRPLYFLERQVRQRIEELGLDGTITLLGQRRDVPLILAASDVLLLVSDWEGTPNVLLEAQHCGCVPVATDAGGSPECMEPGQTGLIVGLHDLEGTVRQTANLLSGPIQRERMAERGRALVNSRFTPTALYSANISLYHQALSDH